MRGCRTHHHRKEHEGKRLLRVPMFRPVCTTSLIIVSGDMYVIVCVVMIMRGIVFFRHNEPPCCQRCVRRTDAAGRVVFHSKFVAHISPVLSADTRWIYRSTKAQKQHSNLHHHHFTQMPKKSETTKG
jgi:hypothetical protein